MNGLLEAPVSTDVLNVLADRERRRVLLVLRSAPTPVDESTLAARLVDIAAEVDLAADEDAERRDAERVERTRVRIRHSALPEMAAAGLVEWDRETSEISLTGAAPRDEAVLEPTVGPAARDHSEFLECLAEERRLIALAVLADADGPMSRSDLAATVAAREGAEDDPARDAHSVHTSLHHAHLPKLDEAGLVSVDANGGVTYTGRSELAAQLPHPAGRQGAVTSADD